MAAKQNAREVLGDQDDAEPAAELDGAGVAASAALAVAVAERLASGEQEALMHAGQQPWGGGREALKCIIVVDGLPKVPSTKKEKLEKHVTSHPTLVKTWGSTPKSVEMPTIDGKTQGYAFLEFETPELALRARKNGSGYKLDKAHTLMTSLVEDFGKDASGKDDGAELRPN